MNGAGFVEVIGGLNNIMELIIPLLIVKKAKPKSQILSALELNGGFNSLQLFYSAQS